MLLMSPAQSPDFFLRPLVVLGKDRELVDQSLGVNPAQTVMSDIELVGIVAGDDSVAQEAMRLDRTSQGSFSGNFYRIGRDSEPRDAKALQMRRPCGCIGKIQAGMGCLTGLGCKTQDYSRVTMTGSATERWFCTTTDEAEAAGCRKAAR